MDTARCTEDGVTYTAVDFSRLPPNNLARKRRLLQCSECGGPAFFRKASRSGRTRCFGARPHIDGCGMAAQDFARLEDGVGDDQDVLHNPGNRIVVDLNFGAQAQTEHIDGAGRTRNPGRGGRYVGDGFRPDAQMHRRLSTLLRTLIEAPAFRNSDQIIEINGHGEIAARNFFVPLLSASTQYAGLFRGYWGLLSDARFSEDHTLWLNSGGRDNISFCLSSEYVGVITQRYRVEDEEDLAGAYILALGTCRVSQNGKLYCVIDEPAYMALRLT